MADGFFPTLVSKDANANAASNPIFVNLADGTDSLAINADGSINVQIPNLDHAEDAAHTSGDLGIMSLAVRRDANTSLVDTDGDYAPLQVDATGSLKVSIISGGSGGTQYAEDTAHTTGDLGTAALVVRKDSVGSNVSADGDYATLLQDANGRLYTQIHDGGNSITVDGTVTVTATDLDIRDLTHVSDSVKVGDGTDFIAVNADGSLNITDNGGSLTVDGTVAVSSVGGTVTVSATDLDIRDLTLALDAVKVSGNSTANSYANPIFVQNAINAITGEVHNYNTAASVAGGATSNHDYTVTTSMKLTSIIVSASGACKFELQTGPILSLVTRAVGFIEKAGGSAQLVFDPPIEVPTTLTGTVRIIRTNREGSSQDLYSTIVGVDA